MKLVTSSTWALAGLSIAAQHEARVQLPGGTVVTGSTMAGVESFNGIPYADAPIGPLRLRPPQRLSKSPAAVNATGVAAACPQIKSSVENAAVLARFPSLGMFASSSLQGQEDCLTVSVQRPVNTAVDAKLPVLFWIHGGGFTSGSAGQYNASSLIEAGAAAGQPFVFVAVNYRLGGFGFMPGVEVLEDGSANIGFLDQRMGLEWVADNIESFGGDAAKVVIWGESAGSDSVFSQMALYRGNATYKGKVLFRGAIMDSGPGLASNPMDSPRAQDTYNAVVEEAGCAGTEDTLSCLRHLDYDTFYNAVTKPFPSGLFTFNGTSATFPPRPDGNVVPASSEVVAASGKYHAVPMIIGDQEDEGTVFALFQSSIETDEDMVDYFTDIIFPEATKEQMKALVHAYTGDPEAASPFRTPSSNSLYPKFKYLAAIMGDTTFTLLRRLILETTAEANPGVPAWSYLASYFYGLPTLGTFHTTDLNQTFFGVSQTHATRSSRQYYFNFLYNLDPNKGNGGFPEWPPWDLDGDRTLMWFKSQTENGLRSDTFRSSQYEVVKTLQSVLRL